MADDTRSRVDLVIRSMAAEGEVAAQGQFTLDMVKAREKLRQFQLLSPHLYVLELVGAAVAGGASSIDVITQVGALTVVMHGVKPYSRTELAHLYANLFLPQEDAALDRLRQLAIALNSALALQPRSVALSSPHPPGRVVLRLTPTSEQLDRVGQSDETGHTSVTVRDGSTWAGLRRLLPGFDPEVAFLRGRCRHAALPIRVNQRAINAPVQLEPCMVQVHVERHGVDAILALGSSLPVGLRPYLAEKERYGPLVWVTGQPPGTPLDGSHVVFMLSGVMMSDKPVVLQPGFPIKVLCQAPGLLKNASQSDVVENARYRQVIEVLRRMVPELMEGLKAAIAGMEDVLADPRQWPWEGSANFRRYLGAELGLARNWWKRWEELGWTPAEDLPPVEAEAAPVKAPGATVRSPEWLARVELEVPDGTGWMALPADVKTRPPFLVRCQGQAVKLPVAAVPPGRWCGRLTLQAHPDAAQLKPLLQALSEAREQLLHDVAADFPTYPPAAQALARRDLLDRLLGDGRSLRGLQEVAPFSTDAYLLSAPIFRTTEGAGVSLRDVMKQYALHHTVHFTERAVAGRSADPTRPVLHLSASDRERLADLFSFTEYSHELEEEERARQLQRERGLVQATFDGRTMLAHTTWELEGLELGLALPRPYQDHGGVQCVKRGILVEKLSLSALPCIGYVRGASMEVDAAWEHVVLPPAVRQSLAQTLDDLYTSIATVLLHLDPGHPDYAGCCRYVMAGWQGQREQLLACGGPRVDPPVFLTRHGRRMGLSPVIQRCRTQQVVEVVPPGDLQLLIPDGVVVLPPDRPWMEAFLRAFFTPDRVVDWRPAQAPVPARVARPVRQDRPVLEALKRLLDELRLGVRVVAAPGGLGTLCWWEGAVLYLNLDHRLVRAVDARCGRDPACLFHLALTVLHDRPADGEGEAALQLGAIKALWEGVG